VIEDLTDIAEFDRDATTPVNEDPCAECGGRRIRTEKLPPPHAAAAWAMSGPSRLCFAATDGSWQWCPYTTFITYYLPGQEPFRTSFERRFEHKPAADDGEDRRRKVFE
jgi:hypothetical protein